jgi:predicted negative regulator of RcsB-dependent stress response
VSDYRTDEETVEQMQRWWRENGTTLIVTIVLVLGGVFGWNWWQDREQATAAAASTLYLQFLEAREAGDDETAEARAETLRGQHADSAYVALLDFDVARRAVDDGRPEAATAALEGILATDLPASMKDVARIRLARLALDAGDAEGAIARLDGITAVDRLSVAAELHGDALAALGRTDAARAAYDAALLAAQGARPLLEMKRDELAVNDALVAGLESEE